MLNRVKDPSPRFCSVQGTGRVITIVDDALPVLAAGAVRQRTLWATVGREGQVA